MNVKGVGLVTTVMCALPTLNLRETAADVRLDGLVTTVTHAHKAGVETTVTSARDSDSVKRATAQNAPRMVSGGERTLKSHFRLKLI